MTATTSIATRPLCGLCNEPKFRIDDIWFCEHCDTTRNCRGERCGACRLAQQKDYTDL